MELSCPHCGTVTKVPDVLIPKARLTTTCTRCGARVGGTVPPRARSARGPQQGAADRVSRGSRTKVRGDVARHRPKGSGAGQRGKATVQGPGGSRPTERGDAAGRGPGESGAKKPADGSNRGPGAARSQGRDVGGREYVVLPELDDPTSQDAVGMRTRGLRGQSGGVARRAARDTGSVRQADGREPGPVRKAARRSVQPGGAVGKARGSAPRDAAAEGSGPLRRAGGEDRGRGGGVAEVGAGRARESAGNQIRAAGKSTHGGTQPVRTELRVAAKGLDPERLARLVASDMLLYNREKVEKTAEEGCLLSSMAAEIVEAWEFYKGRVGEPTAKGTSYFRDAINSILAGGDPIL